MLTARQPTRLLLIGGAPFEPPVTMWWNFVRRSRDEMAEAAVDWNSDSARFGETGSSMARIRAPQPPAPTGSRQPSGR